MHSISDQPDIQCHPICNDQLNMAVFFWYLVKNYFNSLRYCTRVHWTSYFLQGTRNGHVYVVTLYKVSLDLLLGDPLVFDLVPPPHLVEDGVPVPQHPDPQDTVLT